MGVVLRFDLVVLGPDDTPTTIAHGGLRLEYCRRLYSASVPSRAPDLRRCNCIHLLSVRSPLYAFPASSSPNLRAGVAPPSSCVATGTRTLALCAWSGCASPYPPGLDVLLQHSQSC